jgi:hypothetical protein
MVQEVINIGAGPNDGTGDPLRTSFTKINNNFSRLFQSVVSTDLAFSGNTITTGVTGTTNGNLILQPQGTGSVVIGPTNILYGTTANITNFQANTAVFTGTVTASQYGFVGSLNGTASAATIAATATYATTAGIAINAQNYSGTQLPNVTAIGNLNYINVGIMNVATINTNANIFASGNLSTSGFVTGNGYYLSGLAVGAASYGNANAGAYLTTYNGNILASNVNINGNLALRTGANLVISATSYIITPAGSNANLYIDPDGGGDVVLSPLTTLWISDTAATTSTQTGAVIVQGGVGIAGNIYSGGNANISGTANITGSITTISNVNAGNINTAAITATGNITVANLITSGNVTAAYYYGNGSTLAGMYGNTQAASYLLGNIPHGNISVVGVSSSGNISAAYILGNGAVLTGMYGNTQVAAYVPTLLPTNTANISAGNLVATGNVGGTYFIGNGSLLTGMYSHIQAAAYLPTYSGNINSGNVNAGNVNATYFIGSSRYLTGLYSNASVANYLPTYYTNANIAANGVSSTSYILGYIAINGYTFANLANSTTKSITLYGNVSTLVLDNTAGATVSIANVYLPANANISDGTKITISSNITVSTLYIIANDSSVSGNVSSISPTTPYSWHYVKYAPYNGNPIPQQLPGGPRWIRVG